MSEQSRQEFIKKNAHLWGKIDPIDGIPYRPPVEPQSRELPQSHSAKNESIYDEPGRSGLVVRKRWRGRLYYVGVYPSAKLAREALREFIDRMEATRHVCPHCGNVRYDDEPETTCCLFRLQESVQDLEAVA